MKTRPLLTWLMPAILVMLFSCKKEAADTNQAPVANAGADATYYWPADAIELDGSGTDADGSVKRYEWSFLLELNYFFGNNDMNSIRNPYWAKTIVHNLNPGRHAFLLIVTDDKGAKGKDWVNITVIDTLTKSGKEYIHQDVVFDSDNGLFMNSYVDYTFLSVNDRLLYYKPGSKMEVWIMPESFTNWQPVLPASSNGPSTVF